MDGKKTIGLLIEDVFFDFSKEIIHSVSYAIYNRDDIDLVVIAGRQDIDTDSNDDNQHLYKVVYNSIFLMEEKCRFDGLIVALPNMKDKKFDMYPGVPKVFIACDDPDELTINYDDKLGITEAMDFLTEEKGFTKLCMLGGREDNADAQKRKRLFVKYLRSKYLEFENDQYEPTDMTSKSADAALRLLDNNPDVQAVFCVNDLVAVGLYDVMKKRNLTPGKDITVFGFDNTRLALEMVPPLASIGSDAATLGQNALNLLLKKMNGEKVSSVTIPTCLFGRGSMDYNTFDYNFKELLSGDEELITKLFDDTFYRYRYEIMDSKAIDLKKLYCGIISRILGSVKKKKVIDKEYDEVCRLIDIFFENNAMDYTDVTKYIKNIDTLQEGMNAAVKKGDVKDRNNKLFSKMKDRAMLALAVSRTDQRRKRDFERNKVQEYLAETMDYDGEGNITLERVINNFDKLGFTNAALYLYETPVKYFEDAVKEFPDTLLLKCAVKDGKQFVFGKDKQLTRAEEIFKKVWQISKGEGLVIFPVFSGRYIFGVLVCALENNTLNRGEYLAGQLARAMLMCIR
ncbi:MAG: LacI family transcriptional regulator [Lachnospiraceae bacterium]|nr:LacI family transcriptional regulator [Lachnospiraceae bacterium]